MTSSTVSSESAPRSSTKDDSFLISASLMPSCAATIFLTRCSTFSMLLLPNGVSTFQNLWILPDDRDLRCHRPGTLPVHFRAPSRCKVRGASRHVHPAVDMQCC